ncbi:hypothetical protein WN944_009137 [Citrus x changshan-huyou]|uniref:15-cis-phytoene synthase n=1 Tax=Citrus x changshan-huyou TaxID=2935761 RepID=A0AAP0MSF3_9ROSI
MGVKDGGIVIQINGASENIAELRCIFPPTDQGIRIRTLKELIEQLDEANRIFKAVIFHRCFRVPSWMSAPSNHLIGLRSVTTVLDRWEERLQDIFDGRPYDMLDAALTDTVFKFPLDIKVAGTVGLMSVPAIGIAPDSSSFAQSIYNGALNLGVGNQLTNILRDVGEEEILDAIEENDYDNLTKRAYVGRMKKFLMLPQAYNRAQSKGSLIFPY